MENSFLASTGWRWFTQLESTVADRPGDFVRQISNSESQDYGKNFDLLVFDWDGTLLDSTGAIVLPFSRRVVILVCRNLQCPGISRDRSWACRRAALRRPDSDGRTVSADDQRYRYHYLSRDHELDLFSGVFDLISGLHAAGFHPYCRDRKKQGRARSFHGAEQIGEVFGDALC